ncbi:MAG: phosphate/phosphite/phosphonate ABC transporter substrate-binding protein [Deltaproteobacteria bacterium]|nr:phosphate/phosphite/phosphonate ABC transporter substrate-binding protein [Deltaproteobacteria bacterium]
MHRASVMPAGMLLLAACWSPPYREVPVASPSARNSGTDASTAAGGVLRFSVAARQSPQSTFASYSPLVERVAELVGARADLVQRRTYREVNELLARGELDAAMICTGAWLDLQRRWPGRAEPLVVAVMRGRITYNSFLIVPTDSPVRSLGDLQGKQFAYTDELSLTGHAWPTHALHALGRDPARTFSSVYFTQSHDRSIRAVAQGLFDGAAVDSLVYRALVAAEPNLARATRVVETSPPFGMPPVVVSTRLPPEARARLREAFLGLHEHPDAIPTLAELGIEQYVVPPPDLYNTAAAVLADR